MILVKGEYGINHIKNAHNSDAREAIVFTQSTDLKGFLSVNGTVLNLGYNEEIHFETPAQALAMLKILHAITVAGEDAEKAIEGIGNAAEIFFQQAA